MANNNSQSDGIRRSQCRIALLIVQAHPNVEDAPAESGRREEIAWDEL